ncbi:MAG: VOC family protein [Alphaproteobacteria bacterium]|nr:VOC family protein [Alphaproteobacteria bacterium]
MTRIHLSLPTHDVDATTAFYTALFGEGPDKVRPDGYRRFAPADHPIVLSLMPGSPRDVGMPEHWGLRFSDVASTKAAWERAKGAGLDVRTEGEVTCCWAVQQKAWATDPDGRSWELYTVTDDAPAANPERSACCA